jgi:hypothetical protein
VVLTLSLAACARGAVAAGGRGAEALADLYPIGGERPRGVAGVEEPLGVLLPTAGRDTFGLSHLRRGAEHVVVLSRLRGRAPDGTPRWEVRAVQALPPLRPGQGVTAGVCDDAGVADPGVVAVGRWTATGAMADVAYAWRPDAARTRWERLPAGRVACATDDPERVD